MKLRLAGILILSIALNLPRLGQAMVVETGVLPGFAMRGQTLGVLHLNSRLLFGTEYFRLGPYAGLRTLAPQVIDTFYGGAIRIGNERYFELQAGLFERKFSQPGTSDLKGKGLIANMIYGMHLSPHLGIDVVLSGKRIDSGSLDKRTIIDLIPLFTVRWDI